MSTRQQKKDIIFYTVKKVKGHDCNLVEEVDTAAKYVKSGWCIPLRRKLKRFCMISENNPRVKDFLKSTCRIKLEETRHLDKYYYMIHPYSDCCYYWGFTMFVVHIGLLLGIPLAGMAEVHLHPDEINVPLIVLRVLNIFTYANIILTFLTGFYDGRLVKIILDPKRVAMRYLQTHLICDVVSTLHMYDLAEITGLFEPKIYYHYQWILKFPRLITVVQFFEEFQYRMGFARYKFKIVKFCMLFGIIFVWLVYVMFLVKDFATDSELRGLTVWHKITFLALEVVLNILLVDDIHVNAETVSVADGFVSLTLLHCGKFFEMFVLAQILQIYNCYNVVINRYQNLWNTIKAYIRYKQLPQRLSDRIESYVTFRFQKRVFNETGIMETISDTLRNDISWYTCQNLITRVETFKDLPPSFMMNIVSLLIPEIYLPNDVVVQAGDLGSEMFFIYVGVLAVFTPTGKEICHLSDGAHFGEIALLLKESRVATVVAVDFCELYRLTKKDFNDAIEPYPAVKERILEAAHHRLKDTRRRN